MTALDAAIDSPPGLKSDGSGGHRAAQPVGLERLATAVDEANAAVATLDEEPRDQALALKIALEAFHKEALVRIVTTLKADPGGKALLFELVDEPIVRAVLGLHGIIQADPMTRANQALETVRPYLQSHGGDVELVRIEAGEAFVRLQGSCNGCSMSAVTLREGVEDALVAGVAEISAVSVLDDEPTVAFIPLDKIGRGPAHALRSQGWAEGPDTSAVGRDSLLRFDVDIGDVTTSFIAVETDNRISVFRNECVHQGMSLDGGCITDGSITCPWHGFTFEASSGECTSNPGAQLQQVPTRIEDGRLWVQMGIPSNG